jgi:hypothetical protein
MMAVNCNNFYLPPAISAHHFALLCANKPAAVRVQKKRTSGKLTLSAGTL